MAILLCLTAAKHNKITSCTYPYMVLTAGDIFVNLSYKIRTLEICKGDLDASFQADSHDVLYSICSLVGSTANESTQIY